MKAPRFEYVRPADVAGAIAAMAGARDAKLLAGGQSLGPMLNLRLARPGLLVDISRLEELRRIEDGGAVWRIGAGVTHAQIEDAAGRMPGGEMLCEVAAGIAYRSVRNRGTIGGSIAHADPAADWPVVLAALDATVVVRGRSGSRRVAADRFMKAAFTVDLGDDEIVETIEVPKTSAGARWGYYKFCRKTGEYPEAAAAAIFDPDRRVARIFVGALAGAPQPMPVLAGQIAAEGPKGCTRDAVQTLLAGQMPELAAIEARMQAAAVVRAVQKVFNA